MSEFTMTDAEIETWREERKEQWKTTWINFINLVAAHPDFGPDFLNGIAVSICGGDIASAMSADPSETEEENLAKLPDDLRPIAQAFKNCFDMDDIMLDKDEENYVEEADDSN